MLAPLSSVQRDIWFEQVLYPGAPIYNTGGYIQINGKIQPQAFQQAIAFLVRKSEVLRIRLIDQNGIPMQLFSEIPVTEFEFVECEDDDNPFQAALSAIQQSLRLPFRLLEGPLFRASRALFAKVSYAFQR